MQHRHITNFALWQITYISVANENFVCIDFHTAHWFATILFNNICGTLLISLQCCYHEDIAIIAPFSFLWAGGNWGLVSWIYELTYPAEVSHCSGHRTAQKRGLSLTTLIFFSVIKIRWTLLLVGFSYDKKGANVLMWKDKDNEYISSTWIKQQVESHNYSLAKCQPNRIRNSSVQCGNRPRNQHSF